MFTYTITSYFDAHIKEKPRSVNKSPEEFLNFIYLWICCWNSIKYHIDKSKTIMLIDIWLMLVSSLPYNKIIETTNSHFDLLDMKVKIWKVSYFTIVLLQLIHDYQ